VSDPLEKKIQQIEFFSVEKKRLNAWDNQISKDVFKILRPEHLLIFDAGCGEGTFTNVISSGTEAFIVGGDLSKSALLRAKSASKGKNVDFIVCDVENLPFPSDLFDVVVSINLMHHLPDLRPVYEISRVGKPHSPLFIYDHAYLNNPLFFTMAKLVGFFPNGLLKFRDDVGPNNETPTVLMYSFSSLKATLSLSHFRFVYVRKDVLFFAPLYSIFSAISDIFALPVRRYLNEKKRSIFINLDAKLMSQLSFFCYEFAIHCINEKNKS
jgi:SAM-dependent methyltransferase